MVNTRRGECFRGRSRAGVGGPRQGGARDGGGMDGQAGGSGVNPQGGITVTGLWDAEAVLDGSRASTGGRAFSFSRTAYPRENTGDRASRISGLGLGSSASGVETNGWGGRQLLRGHG